MGRFHVHKQIFSVLVALMALFNLTCKDNFSDSKNNENLSSAFNDSQNLVENNQTLTPAGKIMMGFPGGVSGGMGGHNHCGDGRIGRNEECDDGNRFDDDGCDRHCRREIIFVSCHFQCDDPVCEASCQPVCEPPRCHTSCEEVINPPNCTCEAKCEKPECEIQCPVDGCEADSCPTCEVSCETPSCLTVCTQIDPQGPTCAPPTPTCSSQCTEATCAWQCVEPQCTNPHCEPVCDLPALAICEESPLKRNPEVLEKPKNVENPKAQACHPECTFQCDDPVCSARCVPDHCGYQCDLQSDCQPRCELFCERPACEVEGHE